MALPSFRAASAKAAGTTGALAVSLPAGLVAGDIVLLCATTIAGGSISITTAGSLSWTEITSGGLDVASGEKLYVWWGRYTSGSTGPSVTPGSDHCCAGTVAYSGCVPNGSPIGVSTTSTEVTSDQSFSFATGLTTGENDCMCICVASQGNDSNTATYGNMTNTSLASLNNRQDFCTNSGGGGGYSIQEGTKATAGTMGTFASTLSASSPKAYVAFSLRPVVAIDISAGIGAPLVTGFAPTFSATSNLNISANVGALTVSGFSPTIQTPKNVSADIGALTLNGFSPTVSVTQNVNVSAGKGDLTSSGFTPSVTVTSNINISAGVGSSSLSGFSPLVSVSDNKNIQADSGTVTANGFAPSIQTPVNINTSVGQITVTGFSPSVTTGNNIDILPKAGQLSVNGFAPTVNITASVTTNLGLLTIDGFSPSVQTPRNVIPGIAELLIQGFSPTVSISGGEVLTQPSFGEMIINGFAPIVEGGNKKYLNLPSGIDNGILNSQILEVQNITRIVTRKRVKSKIENAI